MMRTALLVVSALALCAAGIQGPFGGRYRHVPATETEEVLLEEGPDMRCVANVEHVEGVLASSCCGDMKCPLEGGVCCKGNSHCCGVGHICLQGDPGTPPGCLDILGGKKVPVQIHQLLQKHHMKVELREQPKPKEAVAGYRPSGKLNYEDAMAPHTHNKLAQQRTADTTLHHRSVAAGGDIAEKEERALYTMPNLPGFPQVPASAIHVDDDDEGSSKSGGSVIMDKIREWAAPSDVNSVGGSNENESKNTLRRYGTDAVVVVPRSGGSEFDDDDEDGISGPVSGDVNAEQAKNTDPLTDVVAVTHLPVRASLADQESGGNAKDEPNIGSGAAGFFVQTGETETVTESRAREEQLDPSILKELGISDDDDDRKKDENADFDTTDLDKIERMFPPSPEVANHDPPPGPSPEQRTLQRLQAKLDKVNLIRKQLREELGGDSGFHI